MPAFRHLRSALWPEITPDDNERESEAALSDPSGAVFVSEGERGLTGFVEVSLRKYADGCDTSPVGYIEAWYVVPEWRRRGVGRSLIDAGEAWARSQGCTEMASDSLLENLDSQRAHHRLGYEEVERAVRFRKDLV